MYPSISVIIICKNEEKVIRRCVTAILHDITSNDELIIIDTGSTDGTLKILGEFKTIKVHHFEWNDNFADARNFGISKASKEWLFFIDSDEMMVKNSIEHLREMIKKVSQCSAEDEEVVFSPKVINTDDSIVYNAGRILKNNGHLKFYGCVHEYPNTIDKNVRLVTLKLPDVIVRHDGYEQETIDEKHKAARNTNLLKKILKKNPSDARYYYFYFRDAKPLISSQEYEKGMVAFFEKFPTSTYSNQVAKDLAYFYIENNKNEEAEVYIDLLFESANKGNISDRYLAIQLKSYNEIEKIKKEQKEILELLIYAQQNTINSEDSLYEHGYVFDELIGLLFFQLEDFHTANEISKKLVKNHYPSHLSDMIEKNKKVFKEN